MRRSPQTVLIAALLVLVAGCSAGPPAAESPAPQAPVQAAEPLTAAEQAFVDRIAQEIDLVFAEYPERYAGRGVNSCYLLEENSPNAAETTVERFSGGTITISLTEAETILAAAEDTVCATG